MEREAANEALVRHGYALWNEAGISSQVEHIWAADVVFHDFPEAPDTGTFHGAGATAARLSEQAEAIGDFSIELHALETSGPYVLTTFDVIGKGARSEIAVSGRFQHVLRIDGDRVKEIRAYMGTEAGRAEFERATGG